MPNPQLSIIIPVYNCAPYLEPNFERLKVLYGTPNLTFEVIFVNDGSIDGIYKSLMNRTSKTNLQQCGF